MRALAAYGAVVLAIRTGLLYVGLAVAAICAVDWAVRTRRIGPFSRVSRFFRGRIEPAMVPVERLVLRAGGVPTSTPWWTILAFIVLGLVLVAVLDFVGSILAQIVFGLSEPSELPRVVVGWVFSLLRLALIVRVVASWVPVGRFSRWIRWSYLLTEWMLAPLRRVIPLVGMIDITPLVAWILLALIQGLLHVP